MSDRPDHLICLDSIQCEKVLPNPERRRRQRRVRSIRARIRTSMCVAQSCVNSIKRLWAVKMKDLIQYNPLSFSTSKRALQRIGAALLKHNANWKDIKRGQPSRPDFFSPTRPCSLPLSGTNHLLLAVMQCQRGARVEREREMECRTGPTFHMLEGILHTKTVGRIGRKGARGETAM